MSLDALFPLTPVLDRLRRVSSITVGPDTGSTDVTITALREENLLEAAAVLSAALATETFTETTFHDRDGRFDRALRRIVELRLRTYLEAGQPVFVATVDDQVVGVAIVDRPGFRPSRLRLVRSLVARLPSTLRLLGRADWPGWYRVYRTATPPEVLPTATYTLEAIGIDPDWRGRGIGRALLEAVQDLVDRDPGTSGVYLATTDALNRDVYRQFGYETVATKRVDGSCVYHMFRPTDVRESAV